MTKTLQGRLSAVGIMRKCMLLLLFLITSSLLHAQPFLPPNPANTEYTYPGFPPPPNSNNSSCYSLQGMWPGSGVNCWLLVHSWEGTGGAGFAWQAVDMANPNIIYDQGFQNYPAGLQI